jgi:prepilin-type N-terminal cleavage/methylation domain-containing protein
MIKKRGFTIVELLIVIVVIGILATIAIVAYNGIQTRAKNAKTVSAATAWTKALKLYNAQWDSWPTMYSCLGDTTTYVGSGGQCWDSVAWTVKPTFLSTMSPFISNYPEPDTTDVGAGTANTPRRGLLYNTDGATYWRMYVFQLGTDACPNIGLTLFSNNIFGSGHYCIYSLNS